MKNIISASRRTDIPAFYWQWFKECINQGYVERQNTKYIDKIYTIDLSKDTTHSIVLWSKNYKNLLNDSSFLDNYNLYFQYTITGYSKLIEPNVPTYEESIITLSKLLNKYKPEQFNIRFDPILISKNGEVNNNQIHYYKPRLEVFDKLCNDLHSIGMDECRLTTSYTSFYGNTAYNLKKAGIDYIDLKEKEQINFMKLMSEIASKYDRDVYVCSNDKFLSANLTNIKKGHCIDGELLQSLFSKCTKAKDKGQRQECGCVNSYDIGSYQYIGNTNVIGQPCYHKCAYCYATKTFDK